jgi:hypothetical protein
MYIYLCFSHLSQTTMSASLSEQPYSRPRPPPLPPNSTYTHCYCEENVYLLAESLVARDDPEWAAYAVFISNPSQSVRPPTMQSHQAFPAPTHVTCVPRTRAAPPFCASV